MSHEIRADHDQVLMFPPVVDDWVGADHPARFIRDFVDALDIDELGFRVRKSSVGRPNYATDLLLKVWLFCYMQDIRSSRQIERACRENMGLIWLTGMNAPDHNSLWRFWRDNKQALSRVIEQSILVAFDANLLGLVVHAVDGTKIMARSSGRTVWHRADVEKRLESLKESIDKGMREVERAEREEVGEYRLPEALQSEVERKEFIERALERLNEVGRDHMHGNEPEARLMKHGRSIELSYNAQAVADQKSGMVVAQDVVEDEDDSSQLVPMIDKVVENLGEAAQETLADGGYSSAVQFGEAAQRNYEVLTSPSKNEPSSDPTSQEKPYHASRFTYDEQKDCCVCPHGKILPYQRTKWGRRKKYRVRLYHCKDFRECPFASQCSKDKRGRTIEISEHHQAVVRQREKRQDPAGKELLKARKAIIEPVFAWVKSHHGFRRWTVCGLENVRTQWSLICATINLRKLYSHWLAGELNLAGG
jgi:transposase